MKHRLMALLCACLIALSLTPAAAALEGEAQRTADTLATLGMVRGSADGEYNLAAPATRAHAAVLLVRMAGAEQAAAVDPWFAGHRDLPAWAAPAINYSIHQGWLSNQPFALDFHPNQTIPASEWCGALLRLCGFTDQDFTADDAAAFALRTGVISRPCTDPVLRGTLFDTALDALQYATTKHPSLLSQLAEKSNSARAAGNALGLLSPTLTARQVADRHLSAVFQLNGYGDPVQLAAEIPAQNASGFFISPDGLAVTNYHSIHNIPVAAAQLSTGETYPVESVLWFDKEIDLAVIRVSQRSTAHRTTSAFAYLDPVGDADVRVGDTVYSISSPLGRGLTVAAGQANAVGRHSADYALPLVVHNADISHGSSGGALLNACGHVVGVVSGAYLRANSMYIAVPVNPILDLDLSGEGMPFVDFWLQEKDPPKQ